jgi:hypothetical protein
LINITTIHTGEPMLKGCNSFFIGPLHSEISNIEFKGNDRRSYRDTFFIAFRFMFSTVFSCQFNSIVVRSRKEIQYVCISCR